MKNVQQFKIDEWARDYGKTSDHQLYGSYASAVSINNLKALSTDSQLSIIDPSLQLSYGSFEGSLKLRQSIALLHSSDDKKISADNVVLTPGSIMANFLLLDTICAAGDHVICQYPTYGQLYLVPKYSGVDVSLWKMDDTKGWSLDLVELEKMIKPATKAIILNNPNNPTGAVLDEDFLKKVVAIASQHNILVFTDEVFSPLYFKEPNPPSIVSLGYTNTAATGSLSKAFSLPGIRLGWIVTENAEVLSTLHKKRDFTTIAVSRLDDDVASFALHQAVMPNLLSRNLALCKQSIALLRDLVSRNSSRVKWVEPQGAGTAFIQILDRQGLPVDDAKFCKALAEDLSIGVIPGGHSFGEGDAGDFKGYMRITLGDPTTLESCLPSLERFIQESP